METSKCTKLITKSISVYSFTAFPFEIVFEIFFSYMMGSTYTYLPNAWFFCVLRFFWFAPYVLFELLFVHLNKWGETWILAKLSLSPLIWAVLFIKLVVLRRRSRLLRLIFLFCNFSFHLVLHMTAIKKLKLKANKNEHTCCNDESSKSFLWKGKNFIFNTKLSLTIGQFNTCLTFKSRTNLLWRHGTL